MRVIEGGNQPEMWTCCKRFRESEELEFIMATETGYTVMAFDSQVLFDMKFCPFCAAVANGK